MMTFAEERLRWYFRFCFFAGFFAMGFFFIALDAMLSSESLSLLELSELLLEMLSESLSLLLDEDEEDDELDEELEEDEVLEQEELLELLSVELSESLLSLSSLIARRADRSKVDFFLDPP